MVIKEKIKKLVKTYPMWHIAYNVIRNRKNAEYVDMVSNISCDADLIRIHKGELGSSPIYCVIESWNGNEGFFAGLRWALDGIYFCKTHGIVPIVRFSEDSLYKDDQFPEEMNPYDYYFDNALNCAYAQTEGKPIVDYSHRNLLSAEAFNPLGVSYDVSQEYICEMARVMNHYIRFNDKIQTSADNYACALGVNDSVLGVHIRGTDYKKGYKNHPNYIAPKDYFADIDKALRLHSFSGIYIATDDSEILEEFKQQYSTVNIIYGKNIRRGTGTCGVHTQNKHNGYTNALDVICDMHALSMCGGLISGMSQVALMSRITKCSRAEVFCYDKVLSNGINNKGKVFIAK